MAHTEAASAVAYHARIRIVGSAAEVQRHQGLVSAFFKEFVSQDNFPDGRMREEPGDILNAVTDESRSTPYRTTPIGSHSSADPASRRPALSSPSASPFPSSLNQAEWQRKRPSQPATYLVCLELAPAVEIDDNGSAFPIVDADDEEDESDGEPSDSGHHRRRWRFAGGMVVEYYPCSTCALLAYLFVKRQYRGPIQIVTASAPSPQAAAAGPPPPVSGEAVCGAVVVGSLERSGSGDAPAAVLLTTAAALLLHGPEGMKAVVLRLRASFGHCQAVLFEANHPSRTSLSNDNMPPHKRLGFYRRMGARQLPVDYIQPPLHDGAPPTRSMLLGCFPQFQPDASRLSVTAVMRFLVEFTASTDRDLSQPIYTDEDMIADLATIDRFEARASEGLELSAGDAAAEYCFRYRTAEGLPLLQEMWRGLLQRRRGSAGAKGGQTSSTNVNLQAFGAALVPTPSQAQSQSQSQASDSQSSEPQSRAQIQAQAHMPTFLMAHPTQTTPAPDQIPSVMLAHLPMTVEQACQQNTFLAWQFTSLEALGRTGIPLPLPLSAIAALGAYLSISLEHLPIAKAEQPTLIWLAVSDTLTFGDGTEGALAEALCALEADTVDTLGMVEPSVCHGRVVVVPACLTSAKGGVILLPQATGGPRIVSGGPSTSGLDNNPLPVFVAAQLAQLFNSADGTATDSGPGSGSSSNSCKLWLGPREGSELRPRGVLRSLASIIEGGGGGPPAIVQPPFLSLESKCMHEGGSTSEGGSDVGDCNVIRTGLFC
jgi:hypothetical protein